MPSQAASYGESQYSSLGDGSAEFPGKDWPIFLKRAAKRQHDPEAARRVTVNCRLVLVGATRAAVSISCGRNSIHTREVSCKVA
jgi:hypothetical protein